MFSSNSKIYIWATTANEVLSQVVNLNLGSFKVANLRQPIQLVIQNHNSKSKAATLEVYSSRGNDVSTHRMNVTTNDSSVQGVVHPVNCSVPLKLTIRREEYECSKDYDYMWTLPRNDTPSDIDPYSFFISNVQLNRTAAGVYYVCVQPLLDDFVKENCSGDLRYKISTFTGSCRYWDNEEDAWKGDGCEVCMLAEHLSVAGSSGYNCYWNSYLLQVTARVLIVIAHNEAEFLLSPLITSTLELILSYSMHGRVETLPLKRKHMIHCLTQCRYGMEVFYCHFHKHANSVSSSCALKCGFSLRQSKIISRYPLCF